MNQVDLIILPFHDYKKWLSEGFRTRDSHLFEGFKNHKGVNKILVVNRPVSLAEVIIKRKSWKTPKGGNVIYSKRNWQLVQVSENSFYLDIFIGDTMKLAIQRKKWWYTVFNYQKTIDIINEACEILEMEYRVVLLQNPMAVGVIGKLDEKLIAFDAIDNWLEHPQNKKYYDLLKTNYNILNKKANLVFTVSKKLKDMFTDRENVYWISNGVDKEYFSSSIREYDNKKITIGYAGKIQDRIDFEIVERCLEIYPNYKFTFLGPILSCKNIINKLQCKYKNIEFKGDIHYNDLASEMKEFDIAIIPHVVNEFTESMNPLKLYEYLAAGKQIVTTKVAGVESFDKYVYKSKNIDEFVKNVQVAVDTYVTSNNLGYEISKSIQYEYTWKCKVNEFIIKIQEILNKQQK